MDMTWNSAKPADNTKDDIKEGMNMLAKIQSGLKSKLGLFSQAHSKTDKRKSDGFSRQNSNNTAP